MTLEQSVGQLTGAVEAMQRDMTEVKADVKMLLADKNSRQGGWKVVAGISAGVGGITAILIDLLGVL